MRRCLSLCALGALLIGGAGVRAVRAQEPVIMSRAKVDTRRPIDFHATVTPETLYVGQQTTYQVAVFLDEVARMRLRRNPEFLPPEMRGLLAYELGAPLSFPPRDVGGKRYTAHVFQKALFPLASGTLTVPSPQLSYALPQSSSYFSREESFVVKAESAQLVVRPLPTEGRPADFTGAVGVLKSSVRLDATTARVGDPLVLTLRVQGMGNVKLLPRPTLEVEWASAVAGTERLQVDTSGPQVKGAKEFDWILTPSRAGDVVTPPVRYSYFNPYTGRYEVAEAAPVTVSIGTGVLATREDGEQAQLLLPLRAHTTGNVSPPLTDQWSLWVVFALFPLPALALVVARGPRAKRDTASIERLRVMAREAHPAAAAKSSKTSTTASVPTSARDVRRLLLSSLAARLDIAPDVLHERARLARLLRRRGVTRETTRDMLTHLSLLDVAAFAGGNAQSESPNVGRADTPSVSDLMQGALTVYDRVDQEALASRTDQSKKAARGAKTAAIALLLLSMSVSGSRWLLAQETLAGAWQTATLAYKNRQFVQASETFGRLAEAAPRDVDAVANWGTASWAAGDTVHAVLGWQRAVRLDPLASDLRERLLLLPPGAREGVADAPLVPVPVFTLGGLTAWAVGWLTLAWLAWRRRARRTPLPAIRAASVVLVMAGALSAGVAVWGARQLSTDGLAVVTRPETIRSAPDGDSDALGGAASGDVVRVQQQQRLWSRVVHSDGRVGWLPSDRLAALTADGSTP